jgi:carbonic anhydrase
MTKFDELLAANQAFASSFGAGDLPMPPGQGLAILTCMDARLHPERCLGLDFGDAHVIRNAGGRASEDAVRSLVISQRLLGTEEVLVLHHTDCGMLTFRNQDLRDKIRADLGVDVGERDFMPFKDLEDSVRDDVRILRDSELIPNDVPIVGAIYDVKTGEIKEVVRS